MKSTYTFTGPGGTRTVVADSEDEARHQAMVMRWGPPGSLEPRRDTDHHGRYLSHGLERVDHV